MKRGGVSDHVRREIKDGNKTIKKQKGFYKNRFHLLQSCTLDIGYTGIMEFTQRIKQACQVKENIITSSYHKGNGRKMKSDGLSKIGYSLNVKE